MTIDKPGSSGGPGPRRLPDTAIGYWRDPNDPTTVNWPDPRDYVDGAWDPKERKRVARYLRHGQVKHVWLGYSHCRMKCGVPDCKMGKSDLTDGVYTWPEGYVHYIEQHQVRPPAHFLEHVRKRLADRPKPIVTRLLSRLLKRREPTGRNTAT